MPGSVGSISIYSGKMLTWHTANLSAKRCNFDIGNNYSNQFRICIDTEIDPLENSN
jgi:hypothetical protein